MDLEQFLQDNSSRQVGGKPLFQPGSYDPMSARPWQPLTKSSPITAIAVTNAERRLQCTFPEGYKVFLQTLGPGIWVGLHVPHPTSLYEFDEATGDMEGFISLCFDVNGNGDYVAFNPKQPEPNTYFCCHDPMGYARIESNFADFVCQLGELKIANPKYDPSEFYSSLQLRSSAPKPVKKVKKKKKRWWEFWK